MARYIFSTIGIRISYIIFEFCTRSGSLKTCSTAGLTLDFFERINFSLPLIYIYIILNELIYYNWSTFCSSSKLQFLRAFCYLLVRYILKAASFLIFTIDLPKLYNLSKFLINIRVKIFYFFFSSVIEKKYLKT